MVKSVGPVHSSFIPLKYIHPLLVSAAVSWILQLSDSNSFLLQFLFLLLQFSRIFFTYCWRVFWKNTLGGFLRDFLWCGKPTVYPCTQIKDGNGRNIRRCSFCSVINLYTYNHITWIFAEYDQILFDVEWILGDHREYRPVMIDRFSAINVSVKSFP